MTLSRFEHGILQDSRPRSELKASLIGSLVETDDAQERPLTRAFCQGSKNQRDALLHVLLLVLLLQASERICLAVGLTPPEERGVGFPVAALMSMQPASLVCESEAQSVGGGLKRLDLTVEHIHLLCSTNISGLLRVNDLLPFPAVDESE